MNQSSPRLTTRRMPVTLGRVHVADADTKLRSLVEAGIALASEGSLDMLLQRLLGLAAELTGARYARLIAAGGGLERFLTYGLDPATEAAIGPPPQGRGILGTLIHEATPLRLHDLAADPRSAGVPPNHPEMHTFLGVPILLRGVAYGNLYLTEKECGEDFTAEDEELVMLLAAQAAVAIENVRLYRAATEWSSHLESLNEVGNALATETDLDTLLDLVARRLRELHDETGQALASILMGLRSLKGQPDPGVAHEAITRLHDLTLTTLRDVRQLAVDLHPKPLDDFGLVAAVERLLETWGAQTGIVVDFAARLGDEEVSTDVATAIFRIVQEALTNVVKHAEARHVSILLTRKNEGLVAVIEDDGRGFDPERESDGSGIRWMRERVELLDGRLWIESGAGSGTALVVEVPVT